MLVSSSEVIQSDLDLSSSQCQVKRVVLKSMFFAWNMILRLWHAFLRIFDMALGIFVIYCRAESLQ